MGKGFLAIALTLGSIVACSGTSGDDTIAASSDLGGPMLIALSAESPVLEYDSVLRIDATVSDPDGASDVTGGTLRDPATDGVYASFVASQEGQYLITVSWQQINDLAPITANPSGADRSFRAQFVDRRGHTVSQDITVKLTCASAATPYYGCCSGEQTVLTISDRLCGSCDPASVCSTQPSPTWADGVAYCAEFRCTWYTRPQARISCADHCMSLGAQCVDYKYGEAHPGQASYGFNTLQLSLCTDVPPEMWGPAGAEQKPFAGMNCLCGGPTPAWYADVPDYVPAEP